MTTTKQDQNFLNDVIGTALLESAISWIQENINPEDVFKNNQLQDWAENSGVSEVFSEKDLTVWALDNGFIKSEE